MFLWLLESVLETCVIWVIFTYVAVDVKIKPLLLGIISIFF